MKQTDHSCLLYSICTLKTADMPIIMLTNKTNEMEKSHQYFLDKWE
jgi:hypothetical protein